MPYGKRRTPRKRAALRRNFKHFRKATRSSGAARPMRALRTTYRGKPNQYRFVREQKSYVIDLANYVLVDPAKTIAVVSFNGFNMTMIEQFAPEFGLLFHNFIVDKITVELTPMWDSNVMPAIVPPTVGQVPVIPVPAMCITRLSSKWIADDNPISAITTDDGVRAYLAQTQMKTRSMYSSKRPLKLITLKPRIFAPVNQLGPLPGVPPTNYNNVTIPPKWMSIVGSDDTIYAQNALFVAQTVQQTEIPRGVYKYRVVVKVDFRCSLVT